MNLLSIGGSDPSSGAGIQSDIKTFDSLNAYGLTAITAITSQNTSDFGIIEPISKKIMQSQMDSIFSDFKIDGIKIGMVYNSEIIKVIHKEIKNENIPIVLDPLIKSTTGGLLIEKSAMTDFKKFLIPLATIITPNKFEAEFISKNKINSRKSLQNVAQQIQSMGVENIAITGLEIKNNQISDFILEGKKQYIIAGKKILKINHGSGCNYAASMLFALTNGKSIREAVEFAKHFTENSIKNSKNIGRGFAITQVKNKDYIYAELNHAINEFIRIRDIYKKIPECQTNFVFSKENPRSIEDILGISGRIVKTGNMVTIAGELSYGGSKHVAAALISMNMKYPEVRSAINLKYNKDDISKLRKKGLIISSYNRKGEPRRLKNKEGNSIRWGIKTAIEKSEVQPDIIYHEGDFGKEPMTIVFAKSPSLVIKNVLKLFN
jgi:hydroxymethylpyrimidine/phosphomethylpyrimidine kinase